MHTEPYIDQTISIAEKIPYNLQFIIDEMEAYDKTGSPVYFSSMDDFIVALKNCYAAGGISKDTKCKLEEKYVCHAYMISEQEDLANGN